MKDLEKRISGDLLTALKQRREMELSSLRMLKAELQRAVTEKGHSGDLSEDEIIALIQREKLPGEGERGLAVYLDDDLSRKAYSIIPTVEEWHGKLWGVTEVQTHDTLSSSELAELTDWLSGQYSDGWDEELEQRQIKVDDGELYVSFWEYSDRFFIKPEDELKGSQSFCFGMSM